MMSYKLESGGIDMLKAKQSPTRQSEGETEEERAIRSGRSRESRRHAGAESGPDEKDAA